MSDTERIAALEKRVSVLEKLPHFQPVNTTNTNDYSTAYKVEVDNDGFITKMTPVIVRPVKGKVQVDEPVISEKLIPPELR